jgi:hypothetical protein
MGSAMTVDQTYIALTEQVAAAEKAIVAEAKKAAGEWWYPYDLRKQARNGWSAGAMGIAMDNLIARGVLEVNADLCVRLRD